jgi:hypothetical protein
MNEKSTSIQKNIQKMDLNNGDNLKNNISNKFAAQQCGTACGARTKHWFGSKNTGGAVN